jgi:hypothetical protein
VRGLRCRVFHDRLEGHVLLAEMGGGGVAELMEFPAGVGGKQDAGRS